MMKTIHDTDIRHALIERFIDCNTTVEEERLLARFYRDCKRNGCVPDGESDVCDIVLATINTADDSKIPAEQNSAVTLRRCNVPWLRIACAVAAAIVAILVMTFFIRPADRHAAVATAPNVTAHDTDSVAKNSMMADASGVSSAYAAATVTNAAQPLQGKASASTPSIKRNRAASQRVDRTSAPSTDNIDITEIYSTVSSLFNDVSNVLIERGSNGILVSSVDENGERHSFLVNGTGDGVLAIKAI